MKNKRARTLAYIAAAFYLAGIIFAIYASMTARTAQGAVAWAVSLVSMPFVAVPAYLVFGRNKFEGMAEAFNARQDEIDEFLASFNDKLQPWVVEAGEAPSWYRAVRKLSKFDLTRNNKANERSAKKTKRPCPHS